MARSSRRSLTGSAAAAAKKVIGRTTAKAVATSTDATTKKSTTKKSTAKKAAPAAKAPAKKAPAKKAPAKKAPAKKAPAKKTPAKKTPAKKTTAKATPVKKTVTRATAAKKAPTTKAAPRSAAAKQAVKKPTAVAARSLKVREDESAWTKAELDEVLAELHTHHDKLVVQIAEAEAELAGLMKDAGDGAGQDQADLGASSFERDHEITVVNNERDMVAQIDRALARIEDGTYGQCESCGQPIGKMRVMAFPRATLCLSCKQREERR